MSAVAAVSCRCGSVATKTRPGAVRRLTYTPRFSLAGRLLRLAFMGLYGRGITRDHFVVALRKNAPGMSAATNGAPPRGGE